MSFRSRSFSTSSTLWTYVLLIGLLCYVAALLGVAAPTLEVRAGLLRYWSLFGAGAFAVAFPHVLLPDARVPLLQMLNRSPARLLAYQWGQWAPVVGLFAMPAVLLAFVDSGHYGQEVMAKGIRLVEHLFVIAGTGAYSFAQYATIGARSQAWQEGRAGRWYANWVELTGQGFSVPRGLVPALFVTGRIFMLALAVVIVAAYLEPRAGGLAAWAPGAVLCAVAAWRIRRARAAYDRHFYHTTAFYREVLGGGISYVQVRSPVTYDAIYWAPHRWRPAVWASLRQYDRVLPLGRLVALGHGLFWLLLLQGVGHAVVTGYLLLFIVAQNGACYVLTRPALAPPAFQLARQSPFDWAMTRFFVNLRWVLPFAFGLGLVALFDRAFTGGDVLFWVGIDVAAALATAVLVTWAHEGTARRRYA